MSKILLIDDDKALCTLITKYAQRENYIVHEAYSGLQGMQKIESNTYELIILDVMLPEINGFSVLTEMRKQNKTPVLILLKKMMKQTR